jgi:hypothetical protein
MAVPWACPLTVEEYASAGRGVEVPRPDCPSCGRPMTFEGWYPRLVRIFPTTWRIFIRRAVCNRCGNGHALLPDFVTRGRLDHIGVIGAGVVAGAAPSSREGAPSPADGPPGPGGRGEPRGCLGCRAQALRCWGQGHHGALGLRQPHLRQRPAGHPRESALGGHRDGRCRSPGPVIATLTWPYPAEPRYVIPVRPLPTPPESSFATTTPPGNRQPRPTAGPGDLEDLSTDSFRSGGHRRPDPHRPVPAHPHLSRPEDVQITMLVTPLQTRSSRHMRCPMNAPWRAPNPLRRIPDGFRRQRIPNWRALRGHKNPI